MKTEFFLSNAFDENEIERLKDLLSVDDKLFDEIYQWFIKQESFPTIKNSLTKTFAKKTNEKPETINNVIAIFFYLIQIFQKPENKLTDFISDFKEIYKNLFEDESILIKRFTKIFEVSKKYDLFFKIEEAISQGASFLKTASMSVVLKPVIDNKFDFNEMDISNYSPKILHYEPCILFEMIRSDNERFSFQMSTESFEKFINHIISIQIELKTVKNEIASR